MREKPLAYEYKDKIHEILQKVQSVTTVFVLSALYQINLECEEREVTAGNSDLHKP